MRKFSNHISLFLFLLLIFILGFIGGRFFAPLPIKTEVKKVIEYLPKTDTIFEPKIIYKDTGTHSVVYSIEIKDSVIKVPIPIDTQEIVKDYLKQKDYNFDTTLNEVKLNINTSVYANRLLYLDYSVNNLRVCTDKKWHFHTGAILGKNNITPFFSVQKNKYSFILGYDFVGLENGLRVGVGYRLR